MSTKKRLDPNQEVAVETESVDTEQPPMFVVYLVNDDYTPMNFVVEVLEQFFSFDTSRATQIMLQVHNSGKGICGVFSRDVAETKVIQVNEYAKSFQHPLMCQMEKMS